MSPDDLDLVTTDDLFDALCRRFDVVVVLAFALDRPEDGGKRFYAGPVVVDVPG